MRNRVLSIRLTTTEYQALKTEADKAGVSVPIHARRKALDAMAVDRMAASMDALERLIRDIPERRVIGEAFTRIAAKIDRVSGKAGTQ